MLWCDGMRSIWLFAVLNVVHFVTLSEVACIWLWSGEHWRKGRLAMWRWWWWWWWWQYYESHMLPRQWIMTKVLKIYKMKRPNIWNGKGKLKKVHHQQRQNCERRTENTSIQTNKRSPTRIQWRRWRWRRRTTSTVQQSNNEQLFHFSFNFWLILILTLGFDGSDVRRKKNKLFPLIYTMKHNHFFNIKILLFSTLVPFLSFQSMDCAWMLFLVY